MKLAVKLWATFSTNDAHYVQSKRALKIFNGPLLSNFDTHIFLNKNLFKFGRLKWLLFVWHFVKFQPKGS